MQKVYRVVIMQKTFWYLICNISTIIYILLLIIGSWGILDIDNQLKKIDNQLMDFVVVRLFFFPSKFLCLFFQPQEPFIESVNFIEVNCVNYCKFPFQLLEFPNICQHLPLFQYLFLICLFLIVCSFGSLVAVFDMFLNEVWKHELLCYGQFTAFRNLQ